MLLSQNKSINFIQKELKGLVYEKPLRKIVEQLPQFYLAALQASESDLNAKAEMLAMQSQISTAFKALIAIDKEQEGYFETSERDFQGNALPNLKPIELEKKWQNFSKQLYEPKNDGFHKEYDALVNDVQNLIWYIGDISKLNLDQEPLTHYLLQTVLFDLPAQLPDIPQIFQILAKKQELTREERDEIVGRIYLLKNTIENVRYEIETVIAEDPITTTVKNTQEKLKEPYNNFLDAINEFIGNIEQQVIAPLTVSVNMADLTKSAKKALQAYMVYGDANIDEVERILNNRLHAFQFTQRFSVFVTCISAIAGFLIGFWTMRNISTPLTNLIRAAKNFADGDLSTRIPVMNNDEVGKVGLAFNQMGESFQALIGQLQWTGVQLTTSTTEIAATAKQQETTIVEQESTTKEIAATAREISATAKDFARTMNDISSTAEQTSSLATSGRTGLLKMETIMRQMVDAAGNISTKLAVLNEKAGSITGIVTTISKVADQTNLLSLNAAIEAEKAGEYGRSFAVIAREIRRLADQTANATLDIEKMVNEMISAVSAGVMGVDKFSEEIHTGVTQVSEVNGQLTQIIEQVQQQTTSFESVNQGMQAQALSAEQIYDSIGLLSEAAVQTTASIRQFHNAIEQLNNAAQEMQNAVSKIKR